MAAAAPRRHPAMAGGSATMSPGNDGGSAGTFYSIGRRSGDRTFPRDGSDSASPRPHCSPGVLAALPGARQKHVAVLGAAVTVRRNRTSGTAQCSSSAPHRQPHPGEGNANGSIMITVTTISLCLPHCRVDPGACDKVSAPGGRAGKRGVTTVPTVSTVRCQQQGPAASPMHDLYSLAIVSR